MTDRHAEYLARRQIRGLDGVRCFAILAVIWHHSVQSPAIVLFGRGFFGVDLFFVLSGYLIATLLLREKQSTGRISLSKFWVRRILRLAPAYYTLLLVVAVAYAVLKPGSPETKTVLDGLPVYALYFSNWIEPGAPNLGVTWSLATEEQFYLVWPLAVAFLGQAALAIFWATALFLNQLINFGVLDQALASAFGLAVDNHPEILDVTFTPILLGVGLAHALNARKGYAAFQVLAGFRGASVVYVTLLIGTLAMPIAEIGGLLRALAWLMAALFVASLVMRPGGFMIAIFEWRPIRFLGMISYGMYLYHMFALHAVREVVSRLGLPDFPWHFLLGAPLTAAVAAASYYILEKRFLDLRTRFRDEPARIAVSSTR